MKEHRAAVRRLVANDVEDSPTCTVSTAKLIGAGNLVDSVTVDWPDGTQDVLTSVNANQVLTVQQTGPPLIPAVSAWGMLIVLLLLLLAGTAIIRDRALLGR
ncbi:MAG: ASPIC/UnbV domain-containing protein [Planctomycetes bacterium]|nr:ASPIC/UnbV domain-containing protein [Planctomycetota bacterium]